MFYLCWLLRPLCKAGAKSPWEPELIGVIIPVYICDSLMSYVFQHVICLPIPLLNLFWAGPLSISGWKRTVGFWGLYMSVSEGKFTASSSWWFCYEGHHVQGLRGGWDGCHSISFRKNSAQQGVLIRKEVSRVEFPIGDSCKDQDGSAMSTAQALSWSDSRPSHKEGRESRLQAQWILSYSRFNLRPNAYILEHFKNLF